MLKKTLRLLADVAIVSAVGMVPVTGAAYFLICFIESAAGPVLFVGGVMSFLAL